MILGAMGEELSLQRVVMQSDDLIAEAGAPSFTLNLSYLKSGSLPTSKCS